MNQPQTTSAAHHQRKRYFIDRIVQGRLVMSLIVMELLIFSTAMWFVYTDLQHLIDINLYRIHQVQLDSLPVLVKSLIHVLPWVMLVNVFALIMVDKVWAGYIRRIVMQLDKTFSDLKKLCITQPDQTKGEHEVITQAKDWLSYEYQRNQEIRKLIQTLPDQLNELDGPDKESVKTTLGKIQQLLS